MEVEVIKFDNLGRGIAYLDGKVVFIPKALPGEVVKIEIVSEKNNYIEGKLIEIIKPSSRRIEPICPYFFKCGGCDLMDISISDALEYKLEMINDLFKTKGIPFLVKEIIKSKNNYNYRNKITLKIIEGKIGFYEKESHNLIEIDNCYLACEEINQFIKHIPLLGISNGEITIRANYKGELLIIIKSEDTLQNISSLTIDFKIVGIIQNDKCIYGDNYFVEKINDYIFNVSFNSFFQVNPYICSELFNLIKENTIDSNNVLDLYCGVGALSIISQNKDKVVGVEIVENAIKNANINKVLNNKLNSEFLCADTKNIINKITNDFDTIIFDPPRSGVRKEILEKVKTTKIKKIIYVSCNPQTLVRDLEILLDCYEIKDVKLLDMFANSYHVECFCVLNLKLCI